MKKIVFIVLSLMFLFGCSTKTKYEYLKEIKLEEMNPISTAVDKR